MKLLVIIICVLSANAFAGEIYKCTDGNGKQSFSDTPCVDGLKSEKSTYEERTWIEEVKARKPVNTTVLSVTKDGIATLLEYQFSNRNELNKFIKLAGEISGKNVYLLKIIDATNAKRGFALIKVTSKGNNLFLNKKP